MALAVDLLFQLLQMTLVIALAPLLTGAVRKVKARLTRRRGAPLWQPYLDLARLARKEAIVAESARKWARSCHSMLLSRISRATASWIRSPVDMDRPGSRRTIAAAARRSSG